MDIIERLVRSALSVETTCDPDQPTTASALIRGADDNLTTITCLTDGNVARIASVSAAGTFYLSGSTITLNTNGGSHCDDSGNSLKFSCPTVQGIAEPVTVSFSLGQPGTSGSQFETAQSSFQTTINVRN